MRWIKRKFWDMSEGVRNLQTGGFTTEPSYPLPRRAARLAKQHWLAHWQWWIGIAINVAGLWMAISKYISC